MYNTRSRGRVASAGSARPHLGMGVRAPPVTASQVTPSQAIALIDDEVVPETELLGGDDVINAVTFDEAKISSVLDADNAMDLEATQPPILTPINQEDLRINSYSGGYCRHGSRGTGRRTIIVPQKLVQKGAFYGLQNTPKSVFGRSSAPDSAVVAHHAPRAL